MLHQGFRTWPTQLQAAVSACRGVPTTPPRPAAWPSGRDPSGMFTSLVDDPCAASTSPASASTFAFVTGPSMLHRRFQKLHALLSRPRAAVSGPTVSPIKGLSGTMSTHVSGPIGDDRPTSWPLKGRAPGGGGRGRGGARGWARGGGLICVARFGSKQVQLNRTCGRCRVNMVGFGMIWAQHRPSSNEVDQHQPHLAKLGPNSQQIREDPTMGSSSQLDHNGRLANPACSGVA